MFKKYNKEDIPDALELHPDSPRQIDSSDPSRLRQPPKIVQVLARKRVKLYHCRIFEEYHHRGPSSSNITRRADGRMQFSLGKVSQYASRTNPRQRMHFEVVGQAKNEKWKLLVIIRAHVCRSRRSSSSSGKKKHGQWRSRTDWWLASMTSDDFGGWWLPRKTTNISSMPGFFWFILDENASNRKKLPSSQRAKGLLLQNMHSFFSFWSNVMCAHYMQVHSLHIYNGGKVRSSLPLFFCAASHDDLFSREFAAERRTEIWIIELESVLLFSLQNNIKNCLTDF